MLIQNLNNGIEIALAVLPEPLLACFKSSNQEAISAEMTGFSLSEGKRIERNMENRLDK